jgi:cation-transporting ATPase E
MMIGLVLVYSVPIARDFLQFTDPTLPTAVLILGTSVACIALIEVVRFVHRRVAYRDAQEALHQRVSK